MGFRIDFEGGVKGFAAGLDVRWERMRGVKICGLNNWKDELPFTEIQGGEGSFFGIWGMIRAQSWAC